MTKSIPTSFAALAMLIAAPAQANALRDDSAEAWAKDHKIMLLMAPLKFGMGVIACLFSVVLISWKALTNYRGARIASLCIGAMSMSKRR